MRREIQLLTIASLALLFQAERGFACLFGECEDVSGGFTLFTMSSLESSSESSSPSPSPGTDQNFAQGFWTVGFGPLGNPAGTTRIPFTFRAGGAAVYNPPRRFRFKGLPSQGPAAMERPLIYAGNWDDGTLLVFDPQAGEVIDEIDVGRKPGDVVMSADQKLVYVALEGDAGIAVVDREAADRIDRIQISQASIFAMAIHPDGSRLYACDANNNGRLHVIDTATRQVIISLPTGRQPSQIVINPEGSLGYLTTYGGSDLQVIDLSTYQVIERIDAPHAIGVALDPLGRWVYYTQSREPGSVSALSIATHQKVAEWPAGDEPHMILPTASGRFVYVTNLNSDFMTIIDTEKNTARNLNVGLGLGPMVRLPQLPMDAAATIPEMTPVKITRGVRPAASGAITAAPNPCVAAPGESTCSARVSWVTNGVSSPEVTVEDVSSSKGETLYAAATVSPGDVASWIQPHGATYVFRLYETAGGVRKLLDSTSVTGRGIPMGRISANSNPCGLRSEYERCTARISWTTDHVRKAEVTVRNAAIRKEMVFGLSVSETEVPAPWIARHAGPYVFALYDVSSGERVLLDSVEVSGALLLRSTEPRTLEHPPL